jgi:hypothetical protein
MKTKKVQKGRGRDPRAEGFYPDREEIAAYVTGDLSADRAAQIGVLAAASTAAGRSLAAEIREMERRALPGYPPKKLGRFLESVARAVSGPDPEVPSGGEAWTLSGSGAQEVLVLAREERWARVAPLSRETGFAGPRDLVVRDKALASAPVLVCLQAAAWVDVRDLEAFKGRVSRPVAVAAWRTERGVAGRLPPGVVRGRTHRDPAVESFHREWRASAWSAMERFRVPAGAIVEAIELAGASTAAPVLTFPRTGFRRVAPRAAFDYALAAAGSTPDTKEGLFWRLERNAPGVAVASGGPIEARLSLVDGELYLVVERADPSVKSVGGVRVSSGRRLIRAVDPRLYFGSSDRLRFRLRVPARGSPLSGRWTVSFRAAGREYSSRVVFA